VRDELRKKVGSLGDAVAGEGRDRPGSLCDGDRRRVVILRVFARSVAWRRSIS
jgi:hypothetical protein